MLHELGWQSLDDRRQDQRLVLFFKIINGLASVETEDIITPADSRTRKNHSFKFKHLQANCDSYRYSFFSSHYFEYVQGTKTVYYLLYKIEGILSTVHKIMYFMNNMLTSRGYLIQKPD